MNQFPEQEDVVVLRAVEEVGRKIEERESRRFRTLYIIFGAVSFIGIGVVAQLIDFYASKAVEQRLERTKQEYESSKSFAQLLSLATKLDISSSFSLTDRDAILRLLKSAKENKELRSEPAFGSLMEKIIDSFAASNNPTAVNTIYDDFHDECTRVTGIVETLLQHYARIIIGHDDIGSELAKKDLRRFYEVAGAASDHDFDGMRAFYLSVAKYKVQGNKSSSALMATLASYKKLNPADIKEFGQALRQFTHLDELGKRPTPQNQRIVDTTTAFVVAHKQMLTEILKDSRALDEIEGVQNSSPALKGS